MNDKKETKSGIFQVGNIGHIYAYYYDPTNGIQIHNYSQGAQSAPNADPSCTYQVPGHDDIGYTKNIPAQCYPAIQKLFDPKNTLNVDASLSSSSFPDSATLDDIEASDNQDYKVPDKWIPTMEKALRAIDPNLSVSYAQGALGSARYSQACPYMSLFIANLLASKRSPNDYRMPQELETALMDVTFGYQIHMVHVVDPQADDDSTRELYEKIDNDLAFQHVTSTFLADQEQVKQKSHKEFQNELLTFNTLQPNLPLNPNKERQANINQLLACTDFDQILTDFKCQSTRTRGLFTAVNDSKRTAIKGPLNGHFPR